MARSYVKMEKHVRHMFYRPVVLKVLGVCFVSLFLLLPSSLSASAHPSSAHPSSAHPSVVAPGPCSSYDNPVAYGRCIGPQEFPLGGCSLSSDVFHTTDANGVPIDWTYSNGSNSDCVGVNYYPNPSNISCAYGFYVPAGHATATVTFHYWDASGNKLSTSLNENNYNGWVHVFSASSVTKIQFTDGIEPAPPHGLPIGWGNGASYGFSQDCYHG